MIEMDSRFGQIVDKGGDIMANPSFIDDDQIASYYLSKTVNDNFIIDNPNKDLNTTSNQVIAGARGTILEIREEKGLVYFINSSYDPFKGVVFVTAGINAKDFEDVLKTTKNIIDNIIKMNYTVIIERQVGDLVIKVNEMIDAGWKVSGGIATTETAHFCQAMTRTLLTRDKTGLPPAKIT